MRSTFPSTVEINKDGIQFSVSKAIRNPVVRV